jgi:hypothetical protein
MPSGAQESPRLRQIAKAEGLFSYKQETIAGIWICAVL